MKTYWEKACEEKGLTYYFEIKPQSKKVVGWYSSGHWKSETGNATSFEAFFEGEWDEYMIGVYGEDTLLEMKDSILKLS